MIESLQDRLRARVGSRRELNEIFRALGEDVIRTARAAGNTTTRACPACGASRPTSLPAFSGPVHAFHRCQECSLLYTPQLLGADAARRLHEDSFAYRSYWEYLRADAAAAAASPGPTAFTPVLARLLEKVPGRDVAIDVGCGFGFGRLVAELRPYFTEAVGLEPDTRTAQAGSDLFDVRVDAGSLDATGRAPGSVDLIVMNQILEHVADARRDLRAAWELLKPGGVLWIAIPHGESLGMRLRSGEHAFVAMPGHLNMFTTTSLRRLAEDHGFRVDELRTDDDLDVSLCDWAIERLPPSASLLALPALALDKALRAVATRAHLPSRLGMGGHLEATLVKPHTH